MQTLLSILSGVALLVWGTHIVRSGVLRIFGGNLRKVLADSVSNRLHAFLAGLGVTALVQSSSATALIASSFVGQNMIGLAPALAIMLGADVGTSLVVQLFSFDLSWLAPLAIASGVILHLSRKATRAGQIGRVLIGIGLIILALQTILAAAKPFTQAAGVRVIFGSLTGEPMLDLLIGVLFTVLAWSSLAVVLLVAAFAASGLIGLKVALFLVLGANLGSGILGIVASTGTNAAGRRVVIRSARALPSRRVAPTPGIPVYICARAGTPTTPSAASWPTINAMLTVNSPFLARNSRVPSSGSTSQYASQRRRSS